MTRGELDLVGARLALVRLRSIGDAVLMAPLAGALRQAGAHVVALLEEPASSLLQGQPCVDDVQTVARGVRGRARALWTLRQGRFDVALDLHGGPTAAWLTRLSGARVRVGLEAYRSRGAYTLRLPSPFKGRDRQETLHTLESNLRVARGLGLCAELEAPRLCVRPDRDREARRALGLCGVPDGEPFVVVHAGAALASKAWPEEHFRTVGKELVRRGERVLWVGPPHGAPGPREALTLPPLELPVLLGVLRRARLFLGNDSGPAHMAAAVGLRTVTIFGSQDPRVWRPFGPSHRFLWSGLPCSPCRGFHCANAVRHECLSTITPEQVLEAVGSALAEH